VKPRKRGVRVRVSRAWKAPGGGCSERRAGAFARARATSPASAGLATPSAKVNASRVAAPGEGLGGGGPSRIGAHIRRPTYRGVG
jgi:hypothetical protein